MHSGPGTCLAAAMLFSLPLAAQWKNLPSKSIPKTADGKTNLSAPAPRSADGHPDLSGIWEPNANRYTRDIAVDLKPGDVPFQPWAKALYETRTDGSHSKEDPDANCLPQGVPKIDAAPAPWKIVQAPGFIVIVYEAFNLWRQAFLDQLGKPSTEALHVIERFRRKDFGHMNLQITIDDPKAYTRPWTVNQEVHLLTDTELLEFICNENNRDVDHLPGK